ncbi:MAG: MFS transporter [Pseudomonadaceae bacterium]|nr:MFS transporter [Pseudomonadaceae bacterium]
MGFLVGIPTRVALACFGEPVKARPLRFQSKVAFGAGQLAEGIQSVVFIFFLLFYYNQVLGVSGSLCGLALALSLVFDAITDPLVGHWSDSWRSKLGRRHPFMFASAVPLGVAFYLLFNPFVSSEMGLFFWLLGFTVLFRGAMTFYHVPHSALGAELSEDASERTVLVAMRHFFGAIAYIFVIVLGFIVYFAPTEGYPNGQLNPAAYGPFSSWLAVVVTLSVLYSAFGTLSDVHRLPQPQEGQHFSLKTVVTGSLEAFKNPSFRALILGFVVIIVAFGAAGALNMYMLTFFWALSGPQILLFMVIGPIGSIFGYVIADRFYRGREKRNGMLIGVSVWLLCHFVSVPLYLAGLLPELGSNALLIVIGGLSTASAVGIALMLVGLGTMAADIADEHELASGQRKEGVFFGAASFSNKCSAALGSLIGGFALDIIDWPTGAAIRVASDIPESTLHMLGLVWGPMTIVLALPGLWFLSQYQLTRARHGDILQQLHERRGVRDGVAAGEG